MLTTADNILRKNRDKSGIQRTFSKEAPEQIGDTECDKEGVCDESGAEESGHHYVTDKAKDATEEGIEAHRTCRLIDLCSLGYGDMRIAH